MPPNPRFNADQIRAAGEELLAGAALKEVAAEMGISTVRLSVHLGRLGYRCGWFWQPTPDRKEKP
jgi:hypothetical protein